jgi:hypothetical protein
VPVTTNAADDNSPAWSPDGTRIAFTSTRSGSSQIWSVGANGVEDSPVNVSQSQSVDGQPDWGVSAAPAPPAIGESLNATAASGTVRAKVPGGRFVALEDATQLPIGTTFDTRNGAVRLTFAAARSGDATQTGTFSRGRFVTRQSKRNPLTEIRLAGALSCKSGKGLTGAGKRRKSRRLFANARGRFRTRGRNSTATVRGTQWLTKDSCKGTLTSVRKGTVVVRDLRKGRKLTLKKGQRYLARAPKRR